MLTVIDCETTGTDHTKDKVVQIGACDLTKTGVINIRQTFVALPDGMTIPASASAVHHIVTDDLAGAPPLDQAIEQFKGAEYFIAHNARFDSCFLAEALGTKPEQWICTYKCALRAWAEAPGHSNQCLRYWLGEIEPFGFKREELPSHSAASDTIVTAAIFHHLVKQQGVTFGLMKQWSQEPALHTVINFSKNKGQRFDQCDIGFLHWILKQPDMDEDKVFSAKYWLEKRTAAA